MHRNDQAIIAWFTSTRDMKVVKSRAEIAWLLNWICNCVSNKLLFSLASAFLLFAVSNNVTFHLSPLQWRLGQIGSPASFITGGLSLQLYQTCLQFSIRLRWSQRQITSQKTDLKVNLVILTHSYYQYLTSTLHNGNLDSQHRPLPIWKINMK